MSATITKKIDGPVLDSSPPNPNWWKIIGNCGVAFFSCLAATVIIGSPNYDAALIAACIQGGLAFFLEIQKEAESRQLAAVLLL